MSKGNTKGENHRKGVKNSYKEPVKVRFKTLANGNKSIYLDFYKDGKREYEFLKLYIVPETPTNKEANAQTLALANAVKAKRIIELQNNTHGFTNSGTRSNVNVIAYIKELAEKKRIKAGGKERGTYQGYMALSRQIENYTGTKTTFKQIDKTFCIGFLNYLTTATNLIKGMRNKPLHENTQSWYMKQFEAVLNAAISDEIINNNPFKQIKPENKPKKNKTEISYLTIDEVKLLENTPYHHIARNAFLFSCYTGLRFSDIQGLTWWQLQKDNNGDTFINYRQKKTQKHEYLPIPQKAVEFLPTRPDEAKDNDYVFCMIGNGIANIRLKIWAATAGIKKHLTFHVARHTYATILLSLGAGIETISKNLGHSEIRTTQHHYAAIENKLQRAAVNLFDKLD